MHRDAVTAAGAALVRFARGCGLIRGEWIAIDGSKFRAVASIDTVRERLALQRYLDNLEKADTEQAVEQIAGDCQALFEKKMAYLTHLGQEVHFGFGKSIHAVGSEAVQAWPSA